MVRCFLRSLSVPIFGLLVLATPQIRAETIAVDEADPPFSYEATNGPAGVLAALTREVFRRAGEPLELRSLPRKRMLMSLDAGGGAAGVSMTPDREANLDHSAPLLTVAVRVYTRRGKTFAVSGVESLLDKRIGLARGRDLGADFERLRADGRLRIDEENGDAANIDKLVNNRIDAVLLPPETADLILAVTGAEGRVTALDPPMTTLPLHLVFAKTARKTELLARIDTALAAMRADGTHAAIVGVLGAR